MLQLILKICKWQNKAQGGLAYTIDWNLVEYEISALQASDDQIITTTYTFYI